MAKQEKKSEYIGGGTKVILTKAFTQFGITYPTGAKLTVDPAGYKELKEGGYLDAVSEKPSKENINLLKTE